MLLSTRPWDWIPLVSMAWNDVLIVISCWVATLLYQKEWVYAILSDISMTEQIDPHIDCCSLQLLPRPSQPRLLAWTHKVYPWEMAWRIFHSCRYQCILPLQYWVSACMLMLGLWYAHHDWYSAQETALAKHSHSKRCAYPLPILSSFMISSQFLKRWKTQRNDDHLLR